MSEAEKKWEKWDIKFAQTILGSITVPKDDTIRTGCKASREAYKAALRREIDKMLILYDTENLHPFHFGERDTLKRVRQLLDTVEP